MKKEIDKLKHKIISLSDKVKIVDDYNYLFNMLLHLTITINAELLCGLRKHEGKKCNCKELLPRYHQLGKSLSNKMMIMAEIEEGCYD